MEKNKWKVINFGAGKAFDDFGRATPFWVGVVTYRWDSRKKLFDVLAVQAVGVIAAIKHHSYDFEVPSQEDVNKFLDYFKELETHYKKVYGE